MSRMFAVVSVVLAGAVLSMGLMGCGGGSSSSSVVSGYNPDGRALPGQTNLSTLKIAIATDKTTYKTGDSIQMTISVTNTSASTSAISFPTTSQTNWWGYIIAQNGKIVTYEYSSTHNLTFTDAVGFDTYGAGETHTFPYAFPFTPSPNSPAKVTVLPPGTYQVYARAPDLIYDNGNAVRTSVPTPASDPVTITVTQ